MIRVAMTCRLCSLPETLDGLGGEKCTDWVRARVTKPEQRHPHHDHQDVKAANLFVSESDSIRRNIGNRIIGADGNGGIRRASTACGGIGAIRPRNVRCSVA